MSTTKKRIAAYVTEETVKKFKVVAATKNKSMSEYTELLIQTAIEGYEIEHGKIILPK
nr:MAG TPA: Arc-like DNA binding domain protein [Inoviridae sp.]